MSPWKWTLPRLYRIVVRKTAQYRARTHMCTKTLKHDLHILANTTHALDSWIKWYHKMILEIQCIRIDNQSMHSFTTLQMPARWGISETKIVYSNRRWSHPRFGFTRIPPYRFKRQPIYNLLRPTGRIWIQVISLWNLCSISSSLAT